MAAGQLGKGALLAKVDIKATFRLVQVHPQDRYLLGVEWNGARYVDGSLSFGIRSAPKVFTAVVDALERRRGVVHYLENLFTMGLPASEVCSSNLEWDGWSATTSESLWLWIRLRVQFPTSRCSASSATCRRVL